ncbi:MAG TPA: serine hydrolase domain-containing protein [Phenylobacterium sp.]|nr:serine hydrolase domain-containing protein [Phenylobacterium sp.]
MAASEPLFALIADGVMERENGGEVVVPWWSFTKTLIAAAVLRLADLGEVELDDVVEDRRFTIRQVLRHEAGLADYGGLAAYHEAVASGATPWPVDEMLARTAADRLAFPPGRGWAYSNIGYFWLRQRVEQGRGDFAVALKELVLAPLGLSQARVAVTPGDLEGVRMGASTGYHPGWVYHGLVVGPLREAAEALDRLMDGDLLSAQSLTAMHQATPLPQFARPPWALPAYGLGLMIPRTQSGVTVHGHTGGGPGSVVAVYRDGAARRSVAVFASGDDAAAVEGPAAVLLEP